MCSSDLAGRAMLAFFPDGELARYRAWAAKHAARPVRAPDLKTVRERGFALGAAEFADARAPVAFPIRAGEDAVAALAVEAPVLNPNAPKAPSDWTEIVAHIESLVRAQPALFENPYGHIGADAIAL